MKCAHYKNQILLVASGELKNSRELAAHLNLCAYCKTFADDALRAAKIAQEHLPDATPHPSVFVAIREAAEARHSRKGIGFQILPIRWVAYAALFLIVAGGTTWVSLSPTSHNGDRVSELSTMVAVVWNTVSEDNTTGTFIEDDDNLKAVAQQLLEMEGFVLEDIFVGEEDATLFDQHDPTTTQWHRTHATPAKTCV